MVWFASGAPTKVTVKRGAINPAWAVRFSRNWWPKAERR